MLYPLPYLTLTEFVGPVTVSSSEVLPGRTLMDSGSRSLIWIKELMHGSVTVTVIISDCSLWNRP